MEKISGNVKKICVIVAALLILLLVYIRFCVYVPDKGKTAELPLWEVSEVRYQDKGVFLKVYSWPSEDEAFSTKKEKNSKWIYFADVDSIKQEKGGEPAGKKNIENLGLLHVKFPEEEVTIETDDIKAQKAIEAWVTE